MRNGAPARLRLFAVAVSGCLLLVIAGAGAMAFGGAGARQGRQARVEHKYSSLVLVPAGLFGMGFPGTVSEARDLQAACARALAGLSLEQLEDKCSSKELWEPAVDARQVYLPSYEIDRYETTVAQYRVCVADGGCDVAALLSGDSRYLADPLPMVNVTWQDAVDYCAWVGKRLPTEAEWEKAARGTDGRRWPWGNHDRDNGSNHGGVRLRPWEPPNALASFDFVHDESDGAKYAVAPGSMRWSAGPYGAYDMAGNVSEWVADWYVAGYAGLPLVNPAREVSVGASGLRVYRGGSWAEPKFFGRTYFRIWAAPADRSFDRGFRCARSVD